MNPNPNELFQNLMATLGKLVPVLDQLQVRYALIGAMATGYRSQPRFTQDLDFLLDIPQLVLPALLDELRVRGFTFQNETTIREWTQDHLTTLDYRGVRIDWLKPVLPCMKHVLEAATAEPWQDSTIRIARPEGLILLKLLAFRTQDQVDIESLLAANQGQLDLDFVRCEWESLGLPDDGRWQKFQEMVARLYASP